MYNIGLLISIVLLIFGEVVKGQCTWDLNTDIPNNNPLYFTTDNSPTMVMPTANGLQLSTNQQMILVCSGKLNTVMGTGLQEITVTCNGQNKLIYNNNVYNLSNFYCTSSPTPDAIKTTQSCGIGKLINLGYSSSKGFSTLISTCYDTVKETVLYSTNILYGQALPAAQIDSSRPSFRTTGLTYGTTTANCYKQTEQLKRFTQLLGPNQASRYITTSSFLSRGHVAPDADFLFGVWADATYFLVNAAPEWQNINAGNWLRVENLARSTAIRLQENITSMTGVHGVLQLPNDNGTLVDIYLMDNQLLRVPKWYWKILYSETTKKGIAFVTSNNPFITSISSSELLCPNICNEVAFNSVAFQSFDKGYTYCCDVNTLLSAVGITPPFIVTGNITGI